MTVVCTRSEPHPALRELLSKSDLEALQRSDSLILGDGTADASPMNINPFSFEIN